VDVTDPAGGFMTNVLQAGIDDGSLENVMFRQMAPMGTGSFEVALDIDMLKDAIVDHQLSRTTLQPKLTECLLAHIAEFCSTITIWWCHVAFWNVSIRNFSILRSFKRTDLSNVFSNVSCTQPYDSRILSY
jgi:hypothetical protein